MLKKIFLIIMAALLVCGAAVASEEQELLYIVRNRLEFNNYPFDLDYLPFGQQLDKFFEKGEWNVEYDDNANIFAVFKGIGRYDELLGITKHFGRKAWITVKVGCKKTQDKINLYVDSIYENNNRIYYHALDRNNYSGIQVEMEFNMNKDFAGLVGLFCVQVPTENDISLSDFLKTIYN